MVTLASTYVGAEPAETVDRYDKKQKKEITIPCPNIIKDYNAFLGKSPCVTKKSIEKRTSSSNIEKQLEAKKPRRKPLNTVLVKDVRTDGVDHNEKRCEKKN
ncbi:unnamed protein product [Parnassius apollo]|uniref:(apollo) hypothetical protein n=1 Tax=Parnassius apollo TaxID=110799 RepID=A0A8S3X4D9_PARAO|nr:unnamed protein product [Parnassius apollo]